jgi:hypothetical protein
MRRTDRSGHCPGDVLDGMVLVDLDEVEPALLARYMGREAASAFRRSHT